MFGRKFYILVLVSMALLAALGVWVIVDGSIAYHNRPLLENVSQPNQFLSQAYPHTLWLS